MQQVDDFSNVRVNTRRYQCDEGKVNDDGEIPFGDAIGSGDKSRVA